MRNPISLLPRQSRRRAAVVALLMGSTVLTGGAIVGMDRIVSPAHAATASETAGNPGSFADLVERVSPAVVAISTTQTRPGGQMPPAPEMPMVPPGSPFEHFFQQFGNRFNHPSQPREIHALGSGFITDPQGYIVTNNHVIENATDIKVTLKDGTVLPAELVGRDPKTDLALIKVDAEKELPYLEFGNSDEVRVGDWVVAVGSPFGLGGTVTAGIVSGRGRDINAGPYDDFLQIDASINHGNSGGPTFDAEGRVVGINTAIYTPSGGSVGIGFAIPSNLAAPVIAELREDGEVDRGWLGVRIQEVTPEIAESLGMEDHEGALVAAVEPESPAAEAGLQQGDVIVTYDGQPIESIRDLTFDVAATTAGDEVDLVAIRDGDRQTLDVTIGELEPTVAMASADPTAADGDTTLGLALTSLDQAARQRFGIDPKVEGVLVVGVQDPETPLRPGDVIVEAGSHPVTSPNEVAQEVDAAKSEGRNAVLFLVNRGGMQQFLAVEIDNV